MGGEWFVRKCICEVFRWCSGRVGRSDGMRNIMRRYNVCIESEPGVIADESPWLRYRI